jgi:hypothetical protein
MERRDDVKALERAVGRAIRHYLILWIGVPVVAILGALTLSGVAERLNTSRPFAALALALVGGLSFWLLSRWLWRIVKR